jgi:hypothetical protein
MPTRNQSLILFCLFTLGLTACQANPTDRGTATVIPTPQSILVVHTPATRPVRTGLHACALGHPEFALMVTEAPPNHIDLEAVDLALRLGAPDPPPGFLAPLAEEEILVILHPNNPAPSLSPTELRSLLSGEIRAWAALDGGFDNLEEKVQVWVPPEGSEVMGALQGLLPLGTTLTSDARLAPSPDAMLEAVAGDPGGIGAIPAAWLDDRVRPVPLRPQLQTSLTLPVLALAKDAPQPPLENLLICLQSQEGHEAVMEAYRPYE